MRNSHSFGHEIGIYRNIKSFQGFRGADILSAPFQFHPVTISLNIVYHFLNEMPSVILQIFRQDMLHREYQINLYRLERVKRWFCRRVGPSCTL